MRRNCLFLLGSLAATLLTGAVYAQPGDPPGPPPGLGRMHGAGGGEMRRIIEAADLSAEQKAQVEQIFAAQRPAVQPLLQKLGQARHDLRRLALGTQAPAADAVTAQLNQIAEIHQQLARHRADMLLKVRGVLTPDQLAKITAALEQPPPDRPVGRAHRQRHGSSAACKD